jgi:hypothetical protein
VEHLERHASAAIDGDWRGHPGLHPSAADSGGWRLWSVEAELRPCGWSKGTAGAERGAGRDGGDGGWRRSREGGRAGGGEGWRRSRVAGGVGGIWRSREEATGLGRVREWGRKLGFGI